VPLVTAPVAGPVTVPSFEFELQKRENENEGERKELFRRTEILIIVAMYSSTGPKDCHNFAVGGCIASS
jgi:hypothetical protein